MAFRLGIGTNSPRKKSTDAITGCVNTGSTNTTGRLLIYSGTQPATPETTATGTLLVTINFATTAFAAADSTATAALFGGTAISATVSASGTAGWFRVTDRDNIALFDGSISTTGADMNFDNITFVSGGTATVNTLTIQSPM